MTSPEDEVSALKRQGASTSRWIESPGFDLSFFVLSPLVGLAFLIAYPTGGVLLAIAAATLIGGPHYLASFSFFFWDDTTAYHRHQWVIHYLIPVVIVLFVGLVSIFQIPAVIVVVIYFWNAYHVSKQSCGILSIYRHRAGIFDLRHKSVANAAIICHQHVHGPFAYGMVSGAASTSCRFRHPPHPFFFGRLRPSRQAHPSSRF